MCGTIGMGGIGCLSVSSLYYLFSNPQQNDFWGLLIFVPILLFGVLLGLLGSVWFCFPILPWRIVVAREPEQISVDWLLIGQRLYGKKVKGECWLVLKCAEVRGRWVASSSIQGHGSKVGVSIPFESDDRCWQVDHLRDFGRQFREIFNLDVVEEFGVDTE